jgi:CBS domain-containing protein
MSGAKALVKEVASVPLTASCVDIADEMDVHSVGCVLVMDQGVLKGIVTDRDLNCRVVAAGLDPVKTTAQDVMTPDPVFATEKDEVEDLLRIMRDQGIRRVPLVEDGEVVGLMSLDDVVVQLSSWVFNVNQGMLGGLHAARRTRRNRRRTEARDDALEELRSQLLTSSEQVRDRAREALSDLLERFGSKR